MLAQTLPEIPWNELGIGVALIVAVVIIAGLLTVTLWKFLPKIIEAWNKLCHSIDAIAAAVNAHISKMEEGEDVNRRVHDEHSKALGRIEHGVSRVQDRLDHWQNSGRAGDS